MQPGRTEEIYGFFIDQEQSLYALLMGKVAGHSYYITSMLGGSIYGIISIYHL